MSMVSEAPLGNDVDVATKKRRSSPSKNNPGKVPKKIHKAEREKLKRDHLNVLFLQLGNTLDSDQQNNGKATILTDASRLLRDLLAQIDNLKKENKTLLSESHYVTIETNELKEENSALEAQIKKLQIELEEKNQPKAFWNLNPSHLQQDITPPHMLPVIEPAPVFVVPLHPECQDVTSKRPSNVSRPHARYPTPSDSWPSKILAEQPKNTQQTQFNSSSDSSTSSSTSSKGE